MSKTNWREAYERDPLNTLIRYLRNYTPQNAPDLETLVYDYYRRLHINLHPVPVRHNPRIYIPGTRDMVTPHILVDNKYAIFFLVYSLEHGIEQPKFTVLKLRTRIRKAFELFEVVIFYLRYWRGMDKEAQKVLKFVKRHLDELKREYGDRFVVIERRSRSSTIGGPRSFPVLAKYPWRLPGFKPSQIRMKPSMIPFSSPDSILARFLETEEEE